MHLQYIYDIIVTSLWHVLALQCHLQGEHTKLKKMYIKMDYIYDIHNLQWNLHVIPVFIWTRYVYILSM